MGRLIVEPARVEVHSPLAPSGASLRRSIARVEQSVKSALGAQVEGEGVGSLAGGVRIVPEPGTTWIELVSANEWTVSAAMLREPVVPKPARVDETMTVLSQ